MSTEFPRNTRQREQVLAGLTGRAVFISAQQLHSELQAAGVKVGLSTVYRTLTGLAAQGSVDVIRRTDGECLYRLCNPGHHHHLVCRVCGAAREVQAAPIEKWVAATAAEEGFTEVHHTLEVVGLCADCA